MNCIKDFLEKMKVGFHFHDGFSEHPVAVKNHQKYFSEGKDLPKRFGDIDWGEYNKKQDKVLAEAEKEHKKLAEKKQKN